MNGINEATIIGNIGADVVLKTFDNGGSVATLSVATSDSWTDSNGERQERTEWHRVVLRNKTAEIAAEYLKKGDKVYIQGPMQTRKWVDAQGIDRYTTEVIGLKMQMLGSPNGNQKSQQQGGHENTNHQNSAGSIPDDIPYD